MRMVIRVESDVLRKPWKTRVDMLNKVGREAITLPCSSESG